MCKRIYYFNSIRKIAPAEKQRRAMLMQHAAFLDQATAAGEQRRAEKSATDDLAQLLRGLKSTKDDKGDQPDEPDNDPIAVDVSTDAGGVSETRTLAEILCDLLRFDLGRSLSSSRVCTVTPETWSKKCRETLDAYEFKTGLTIDPELRLYLRQRRPQLINRDRRRCRHHPF